MEVVGGVGVGDRETPPNVYFFEAQDPLLLSDREMGGRVGSGWGPGRRTALRVHVRRMQHA